MSLHKTLALILLVVPLYAHASEPDPASMDSAPQVGAESLEPEVTIIQRGAEAIEEYRINNQLYMIKITPAKGYAYYLIDTDGDGNLDTRRNDLDPAVLTPQWTLLRWK